MKVYNDEGVLIFEGECVNGYRNGKGKEYDNNGKLIFEGEYSNGSRKEGKEYDSQGELIYEGEFSKEKNVEKVKNIIKRKILYLKVNFFLEKGPKVKYM